MILVTGSTGFVGRHLVPRLVETGWPVRVVATPGRGGTFQLPWPNLRVEPVEASLNDGASLATAMQGVHTVFHLASAQWWGSPQALELVEVEGMRRVIEAARLARIGRLVVMSHLGAAPSSAYALLRNKGQMEALVQRSGVPYTILRSGVIFGYEDRFVNGVAMLLRTNPLVFIQPGQGETLLHPLFIDDLCAALVQSMDNLDTVDRVIEVGGPEYVSFSEMVRTVMRVTQAPRTVVSMPPYAVRTLTHLARRIFRRWPSTPQWFDLLASHRTASLSNMSDIFGIRPVRFEDTLVKYMPARHYGLELVRFLFRRRRPRGL